MTGVNSLGRRRSKGGLLVAFLALAASHPPALNAQMACEDVSGVWTVDLVLPGSGASQVPLTLEQTECTVTGSVEGRQTTSIQEGEVEGSTVTFTAMAMNQSDGQGIAVVWEGTVDHNEIRGTLSSPMMGTFDFSGSRSEG